ncbi:MAG: hypothetical protein KDB14_01810 [Planctomycetales bacterium]|nr:hypothetical protein [Planctomycetales bacterium]
MSSDSQPILEQPEAPDLEVVVYLGVEQVWKSELPPQLEVGRQNMGGLHPEPEPYVVAEGEGGVPRLIIAAKSERRISRRHIGIRVSRGAVTVANLSRIQPFVCNHAVVEPGEERVCDGHTVIRIELDDRSIIIGPCGDSGSLRSLANQTRAPGFHLSTRRLELSQLQVAPPDQFMTWLSDTIEVLHSAASSPDFLRLACQAVVDIVKLDHAQVLLREDGHWQMQAAHTVPSSREAPTPSRVVLRHVVEERRTYWMLPTMETTESLMGVSTVIASPILASDGDVIGAIYGDRRASPGGDGISELEARMVEVLTYAVASGLSRLKQEEEAMAERVNAAEKRTRLEQFFSPLLASQLLERPSLLEGRDVEVTVLFCDLQGFAKLSDMLAPRKVLQWLNAVQDLLSDCVIHNQGVLVDYVGDALLAMWGAPIHEPDHPLLACRAAASMIRKLPGLDAIWRETIGGVTRVGIGISTGMSLVGNTGSARKFKYGPLGRTVNLGSRVQDATRILRTPILVAESTALRLRGEFETRRVGQFLLHNLQTPETLHELNPAADDDWRQLRDTYEAALNDYDAGQLEAARERLADLQRLWPDDGPSNFLRHALDAPDAVGRIWQLKKHEE